MLCSVLVYFVRRLRVQKDLKRKAEHESADALCRAFQQSELRSLLAQVDEEAHAAAGEDGGAQPSAELCAEAEREVEHVLSAPTAREVLGIGSPNERTARFRQLVRLLHPDKGLVTGARANMAFRRVVEAKQNGF